MAHAVSATWPAWRGSVRPCPPPGPSSPTTPGTTTRDTLHAHTQVLGKLAVTLAPPEPQLQHAALRLTARGWETAAAAGARRLRRVRSSCSICTPTRRSSSTATAASAHPAHARSRRSARSRASCWPPCAGSRARWSSTSRRRRRPGRQPLDEDDEHATFDTAHVDAYFAAATRAAMVLAALRAPYRGRSTPVNAWWGSFDLAVSLFSGKSVEPPGDGFIWRNAGDAEQVEIGWWPGDARYPTAAFFAYAFPAPAGFENATLSAGRRALGRRSRRVHPRLGRHRDDPDPHASASQFARSPRCSMPARCAAGIPPWRPAPRAFRRRSLSPIRR